MLKPTLEEALAFEMMLTVPSGIHHDSTGNRNG